MSGRKLLVLVADPQPASRLAAVDALRDHYDVQILPEDDDPVRVARRARPALILLAVPSARIQGALRAARSLKTEASPPAVALTDRGGRIEAPEEALAACLADGYVSGVVEPAALQAFVAQVLEGKRPVLRGRAQRGLIGRLLGR